MKALFLALCGGIMVSGVTCARMGKGTVPGSCKEKMPWG